MEPSDDELIAQYLAGSEGAFGQLYDRYCCRLLGFVLSLGGNRADCEDVVQNCWIRVAGSLPTYRPGGRFRSWLMRIAYRLWLDDLHSAWRKRVQPSGDGFPEESKGPPIDLQFLQQESPLRRLEQIEEQQKLYQAIDELPNLMRQTLLLRIDGEMTYREIAEAMHCPLGTALWRARESEKRLKRALAGKREGQPT